MLKTNTSSSSSTLSKDEMELVNKNSTSLNVTEFVAYNKSIPSTPNTTLHTSCQDLYKKIFNNKKTICLTLLFICCIQYYNQCSDLASSSSIVVKKPPSELNNDWSQDDEMTTNQKENEAKVRPRIILWTPYYMRFEDYAAAGLHNSTFTNCPYSCEIVVGLPLNSTRQIKLQSNDALIMTDVPKQLPSYRHPDQTWVLVLHESPSYTPDYSRIKDIFNWTMTYRLDSDIYHPFGHFVKYKFDNTSTEKNDLAPSTLLALDSSSSPAIYWNNSPSAPLNKTKLAAIQVSHCNTVSNRESLLRELSDYIPIDVYGACGNLTCRQNETNACGHNGSAIIPCAYEQGRLCFQEFGLTYKFYLAFENSLCLDYITEKFWHSLANGMVPVVYNSGANYSAIAPHHSYINVADFNSTQALANYLLFLDTNDEEYYKYFKWQRHYKVVDSLSSMTNSWCSLCTRLNTRQGHERKNYADIGDWWKRNPNYYNNNNTNNNASVITTTDKDERFACKSKPKFRYNGWADPRKRFQYK